MWRRQLQFNCARKTSADTSRTLPTMVELPITIRLSGIRSDGHPDPEWTGTLRPCGDAAAWEKSDQPAQLAAAGKSSQIDPLRLLSQLDQFESRASRNDVWAGFLSYDVGRLFEVLPNRAVDDLSAPLLRFFRGSIDPSHQEATLSPASKSVGAVRSNFTRAEYLQAVHRVIEYIRAGDIFQVNFAQRLTLAQPGPSKEIFDRMCALAPARYGALLDFGDLALISNSPELFFKVIPQPDGSRRIITRPIKGTRPRRPGMEDELRLSAKDQAELNMIVDLERNDLGRICQIGSVKVTQRRSIEAHPTVFHGVATVEGILRPDVRFVDILRAMFPGGSISGAPKIRAMEIIDELEPVRRGPYCGAIGYIKSDGSMHFSLAIRTIVIKNGLAHVSVGGGIVADSIPEAEYEETLVKSAAMLRALGVDDGEIIAAG